MQHSWPFALLKVTAALRVRNEGNMFNLKPYFFHLIVFENTDMCGFNLALSSAFGVDIENGPRWKECKMERGAK